MGGERSLGGGVLRQHVRHGYSPVIVAEDSISIYRLYRVAKGQVSGETLRLNFELTWKKFRISGSDHFRVLG